MYQYLNCAVREKLDPLPPYLTSPEIPVELYNFLYKFCLLRLTASV